MGNSEARLINGPIGKTLFRMANPMVWGMFAVISLNLVDTFFVARLGTDELAAVTFTFPFVIVLMNLAIGLSVGTGSVVSRAIGRGDCEQVRRLTTDSLIISLAIMFCFTVVGFLAGSSVFKLLGATKAIIPLSWEYMSVWLIGLPFVVVPMVGNAAMNSAGEVKLPALMMFFAAIVNLVLDPLLIFGLWGFPQMGVQGAALATVIAYSSTCFIALWLLSYKMKMLTAHLKFKEMIASWKAMLHIAIPSATAQMIVPMINGISLWMLAHYGPAVVASYGIVSRLEAFSLIILYAISTSLGAFVGQNWGAKKYDRVQRAIQLGYYFAFCWGLGLTVILGLCSTLIPGFFNTDPEVINTVSYYLLTVPLSYGAVGCIYIFTASLNAIGKPMIASSIMILRHVLIYLPMALIAVIWYGVPGIFAAITLSNLVVGLGAFALTNRFLQPCEKLHLSRE